MSNSVLLVISLLFLAMFLVQTLRIRNIKKLTVEKKDDHVDDYVKPDSYKVNYLEKKVLGKAGKNIEPLVEHAAKETADSVLGINANSIKDEISSLSSEADEITVDDVPVTTDDKWIVFFIQAEKDSTYSGYELLQAILSSGLRYGENNIFHHYESSSAKGKALFHLASAIQPGTFELPKMGAFSTSALTLFFNVKDVSSPAEVLEKMLHVAGQLSDDLGGKVLDDSKELLTKEKVREIYLEVNQIEKSTNNFDLFAGTEQQV